MRWAAVPMVLLATGCTPPPPMSLAAVVSCAPEARPLRQRCTVRLSDRRTGRAVTGAAVTLHADMPSMPLAHNVPPVTAAPGPQPGTYQAVLELDMTGRWVIAVRVAAPVRDQLTHVIEVE